MILQTVNQAVQSLNRGNILAYPTESMYGLGADPNNADATAKLKILKERNSHGFILISHQWQVISHWVNLPEEHLIDKALASWPGPTTWIMPASNQAPDWIIGPNKTIAIRIPNHPFCKLLCKEFNGPIISTSANPKGMKPAQNKEEVAAYFESVDIVIGNLGDRKNPSTIIDLLSDSIYRS